MAASSLRRQRGWAAENRGHARFRFRQPAENPVCTAFRARSADRVRSESRGRTQPRPRRGSGAGTGAGCALTDGVSGDAAPQIFSDRAFDLSLLEGVEGAIELKAGRLDIGADMALTGASAILRASEGKLGLEIGGRQAVGGDLKARWRFPRRRPVPSSAERWKLRTPISRSCRSLPGRLARAVGFGSGRASLKLGFEGRGLSPRGMITVMTGKGRLQLDNVALKGLAADGIRAAAEETLKAETFSTDELVSRLNGCDGRWPTRRGCAGCDASTLPMGQFRSRLSMWSRRAGAQRS